MSATPPNSPGALARIAPLAAILTGLVLCISAFTKFLGPKAFVSVVSDYGLFPDWSVLPVATGVTALELALGLMLVSGIGRRVATRIALPLVVLFIVLVSRAISTGMTGCGCFGEVIEIPPRIELGLDAVLLLLLGIVWRAGEDFAPARGVPATVFGWGALCLGAVIFLARGPVVAGEEVLEVQYDDLAVLAQADPPLPVPRDGFLFFFSADCDHCWAYAGGVELMARRIEDFEVAGVTLSDPLALEGFRESFQPSYPIHVMSPRQFNALVATYPAGIWIQDGRIARTWAGYVPGLRQIVEEGGYQYAAPQSGGLIPEREESPFGGVLRGRQ
jgi:hypothetical protein